MLSETQLLNHIYQNADMAQNSLQHILNLSHSSAFTKAIQAQLEGFQKTLETSKEMLKERGKHPDGARLSTKMMADFSQRMNSLLDPSDSKLAEMVIQGNSMGITKLTRQIHDYDGEALSILNFAKQQIRQEQENIEQMKPFL